MMECENKKRGDGEIQKAEAHPDGKLRFTVG